MKAKRRINDRKSSCKCKYEIKIIQNKQMSAHHGHKVQAKAGGYMDLFDYMREQNQEKESPLASRLRPTTLDEMVG